MLVLCGDGSCVVVLCRGEACACLLVLCRGESCVLVLCSVESSLLVLCQGGELSAGAEQCGGLHVVGKGGQGQCGEL